MSPRYSIVIPTRNRAGLLRGALASALQQTHSDYEIVVSNNACDDDTDTVVAPHLGERVRLVHTGRVRAMHAHWNFALGHARGEYVIFLCDDDAMHPRLLETLDGVIGQRRIELLVWSSATYVHPNWPEPARRNLLYFGLYSNQVRRVPADVALQAAFGLRWPQTFAWPLMLNGCVRRDLAERQAARCGGIFQPTSPDYSALAALLAGVREYLWLDAPLMLTGEAAESIGVNATRMTPSVQAFLRELEAEGVEYVQSVPLTQRSAINSIADTLLRMRERFAELRAFELDWAAYFAQCRFVIDERRRMGWDVASELGEHERALAARGAAFASEVTRAATGLRTPSTPAEFESLGPVFEGCPGPLAVPPARGAEQGFGDSAACAAALEGWLRGRGVAARAAADEVLRRVRAARPAFRRVVLYGMGKHGAFLWNALREPLAHAGVDLRYADDRFDGGPGRAYLCLGREVEALHRALVVVTPWDADAMARRVRALAADATIVTWAELLTATSPSLPSVPLCLCGTSSVAGENDHRGTEAQRKHREKSRT